MESFGNYLILETISDKGTSQVYLAKHKKLGRKTLLKVYSGVDETFIKRFEREARIVAELNDESIVSIYDFGEIQGRFYISLEYVEGYNLNDYLKSRQLEDEEIIDLALKIARGVSVLHRKGFIHRDLKPENILVNLEGKIKITDFGVALHDSSNRITNEGDLLGTPLYMSPEQINNLPITTHCDVFALGIIFYQIATGLNPFEAGQYGEIFSKILCYHPPLINTIQSSIPKWFADLVDKLLQKDLKDRIQNAQEIVEMIESNIERFRRENHLQDWPEPNPLKRHSARWIVAISVLVLVILFFSTLNKKGETVIIDRPDSALIMSTQLNASVEEDSIDQNNFEVQTQPEIFVSTFAGSSAPDLEKEKPVSNLATSKTGHSMAQTSRTTSLLVKTWPWCRVYLNYAFLDDTPMTSPVPITPGRYLLSLQNPFYPSWSDSILVLPHITNEFAFDLDSLFYSLELQVMPWGNVFVDGNYKGTTPLQHPLYLSRDNHIIKIENSFYPTWVDTIVWNGEDRILKRIVLQAQPN